MVLSQHLSERLLKLFTQKPLLVFFRVFVLTWAIMSEEFRYIILFFIGASIWIIESIALSIDPKLAESSLIRLSNTLFFILVILVGFIHLAPYIPEVSKFLSFL